MTKKCDKCGEEKPIEEFYQNKNAVSGYLNACKECVKREARERYKARSHR